MLKDEFEEIIELLEVSKANSITNIQDVLMKVLLFFRKVNNEFAVVSKSEKEELIQMLSQMQKKLQKKIEEFCRESGVSEEQLMQISEQTSNMTPQQKVIVDATKTEMNQISKNIKDHLRHKHSAADDSPLHKKDTAQEATPKKKQKRDRGEWKKS
jgi:methyl-accepting chemotaxis protein